MKNPPPVTRPAANRVLSNLVILARSYFSENVYKIIVFGASYFLLLFLGRCAM